MKFKILKFTLIDLLLKWKGQAWIFGAYFIEQLLKNKMSNILQF